MFEVCQYSFLLRESSHVTCNESPQLTLESAEFIRKI